MTTPLTFELEESEGADLGRVAGVKRTCARCGQDSWTGTVCTACTVAGAPASGFAWCSEGVRPRGPQEASERVEAPDAVTCPLGCGCDQPMAVIQLGVLAVGAGWNVQAWHSRGTPAGARTVKNLWSVRFRRPGWMGYAVHDGSAWSSVCVAGTTLSPVLTLGVTELREWLAEPDQEANWYAEIKQRRAAQALAGKQVKCPGPGECAWVDGQRGEHTHRANGDIKIKRSRKERMDGG